MYSHQKYEIMKQLEIKFDLPSLLEDMAQLAPKDLGVDRLMIIVEKDDDKHETTSTRILMSGEDVLDPTSLLFRAMKKESNLAVAVCMAATAFTSQTNSKKP